MNPCINCPLDAQGCHESGFANAKCAAWSAWKTTLLIFKAESALQSGSAPPTALTHSPINRRLDGIRAKEEEMIIAVKCTKCDWQGNAEVGRRKGGAPLNEQQCPKCNSQIRRRPGRYNWGDEEAKIKGGGIETP